MGKATEKMKEFAEAIAYELDIDEPDYDNFDETKEFIDENKDDFYASKEDNL